jgi:hypothetical protein
MFVCSEIPQPITTSNNDSVRFRVADTPFFIVPLLLFSLSFNTVILKYDPALCNNCPEGRMWECYQGLLLGRGKITSIISESCLHRHYYDAYAGVIG